MKHLTIIAFYILAITLAAFAAPPPSDDEPPITSKEQLVERLSEVPRRPMSWADVRDELRIFVENHPEIIPFLPQLRDHRSPWIRTKVFEIELLNPDLHDEAVRRAMRSGDPTLEGRAMSHVGPLLGEPEIAKIWLTHVRDDILEYGGLTGRLAVLKDAPDDVRSKLESELARRLLEDLREGQITTRVISSVITFLRERPEIEREILLEAVIAADSSFDERFEEERNQYALPDLAYVRARNSFLMNRVYLGDDEALVTILTNATTRGGQERSRYLALLAEVPPTIPLVNAALELLVDTEQVRALPPPSHGPPDAKGTPILARDYAAFIVREWFDDAPGRSSDNYALPMREEQITDLLVWLPRKIAELRLEERGIGDDGTAVDDDGGAAEAETLVEVPADAVGV